MNKINQYKLIIIMSILYTAFYNFTFFKNFFNVYPFSGYNVIYALSTVFLLLLVNVVFFTLFSSKYTTKPLLLIITIISSFCAYFMDTYHVVIDTDMMRNIFETNLNESSDLFSLNLIFYILLLGLIPSIFIIKTKIIYSSKKIEFSNKVKVILISIILIMVIIFSFSKFYSSFFREHKPLRYNVNPIYWIYSFGSYINKSFKPQTVELKEIGKDSKIEEEESEKKELIIMVVGETARSDRFSLNGYSKETNPLLKKEDIINFENMYSCGTSTAVSVPCMFSIFDKADYDYQKGISTKNILDVLKNTNDVDILWRDNNSDSKGVALRVEYQNFKTPKNNPICDEECRDEGMIIGLDKYIDAHKNKDILIVLHQMGNHGPAYYKRYPKEFEKFTPVCKSNQLEECSKEELDNAYDNAILYTDYFLSKVINFLKPYSKTHETAMIYMSDHGESLGENGLYLHGMPYFMAPKEQIHIPGIIWLGDGDMKKEYDINKLNSYKNNNFSQDNLFSTLLGIFEVETEVYDKNMDILHNAKKD